MQTLKSCVAVSALAMGLGFSIAGYGVVEVNPPKSNQQGGVAVTPDGQRGTVQVTPPQRPPERAQRKRGDAPREGVSVEPGRKHGNATVLSGVEAKAKRNAEAKRKAEARRNAARDRNSNRGTVEVRPGDAPREGAIVVPGRKHGNATVMSGVEAKAKRNAEAKRKAEARRNAARDRKSNRGTVEVR